MGHRCGTNDRRMVCSLMALVMLSQKDSIHVEHELTFTTLLSPSLPRVVVPNSTLRTNLPTLTTLPPHAWVDLHWPSSYFHPVQVLHCSISTLRGLKVDKRIAGVPPCERINRHGDANYSEAIFHEQRLNILARGGVEKVANVETCARRGRVSYARRAHFVAVLVEASVVATLRCWFRSSCGVLHAPVARGLGSARWGGATERFFKFLHIG